MSVNERIKKWSRALKSEALTVWYISKHPNTPWYARALALGLVAYAFSPIDLIPDFVPVLGYVDDLIILPIGVLVMLRITPEHVLTECREKAQAHLKTHAAKPRSRWGAGLTVAAWAIIVALIGILFIRR